MTNASPSLDDRYLDFHSRTTEVFAAYPGIEPLRYFIFKNLLIQRTRLGFKNHVHHCLRPILRRHHSHGSRRPADVLVWIESSRETSAGTLLPVHRELTARGIQVQLVSLRGPGDLPSSTLHFQFPARVLPAPWAKASWNALCDVVPELRFPDLKRHFMYASADIQGMSDEFSRVLDAIQPKMVLTAVTQIEGGSALVVSSRSRGATSVVLQHGLLQPFYVPVVADLMLTWGESSIETLTRLGVPQGKLVACGSPRHDPMRRSMIGAKASLLRELSLPKRPTLVFFSNGNDLVRNGVAPLECAQWLESVGRQYSGEINVIVRLHPNEDGIIYRHCRHLRITKDSPNLEVTLGGADIVASLCSTALYEAILFKKPVLQFHADHWPMLADNWKHGLALRISSEARLSEILRATLAGGKDSRIDPAPIDRVFANHGRAAKAVADYIQGQLQKAKSAA